MLNFKTFDQNPLNSPENVLAVVEAKFCTLDKEMPRLLSEFIKLLGNEKEEWGGVKAMKACVKEFFTWKNGNPKQKSKVSTAKDLEEYLFAVDRHVLIHVQEPDHLSNSKSTTSENLETLKRQDRPKASKSVVDPAAADAKTIKTADHLPSTSKVVTKDVVDKTYAQPPNQKTLKVKIYMGTGWEIDSPKLHGGSPPRLYVNLTIDDGKSQETKVQKNTWTPCWEEEFDFSLSSLKDSKSKFIVKVFDSHKLSSKKFAGEFSRLVSELKQGLNVIPLSYEEEKKPCRSARLLVRFMFV